MWKNYNWEYSNKINNVNFDDMFSRNNHICDLVDWELNILFKSWC